EQHPEALRESGEKHREGEERATEQDEPPSARRVGEERDRDLDEVRREHRKREEDSDLGVAQSEVVANLRPRGLTCAEGELVEELDGEKNGDEEAQRPQPPGYDTLNVARSIVHGDLPFWRARLAYVLWPATSIDHARRPVRFDRG